MADGMSGEPGMGIVGNLVILGLIPHIDFIPKLFF